MWPRLTNEMKGECTSMRTREILLRLSVPTDAIISHSPNRRLICEIGVYPSQSLYIRGYAYTWFRTFSCHRKKARNTSVVYGNYDNAAFFFTTIASNYLVTLRALIRLQNLTEILLLFAFLQGDGVHRYMSNFFFWWKPYNHEKGLMSFSHLDKLISVTVIIAETI